MSEISIHRQKLWNYAFLSCIKIYVIIYVPGLPHLAEDVAQSSFFVIIYQNSVTCCKNYMYLCLA